MEKKALLIYNPKAGRGQFLSYLHETIDRLVKGGYRVEVYPTQSQGDAAEFIRNLEGDYDLLVPAGGDGTLDEVVTGMLRGGRNDLIGYIPVGSTNDYAASLGIPAGARAAMDTILGGTPFSVDAGVVNGEHIFIYVAAFGAFTDVAYATDQNLKNTLGHAAYLVEAMKRLPEIKPHRVRAMAGSRVMEHEYILGMVTNATSVGGFRNITGKNVVLDDGLFEVTLVHNPANLLEMQEILTALLTQTYNTELIDYFKTDHLVMESREEISWTFDGEYGGSFTHLELQNNKQSVRIQRMNG